MRNDKMDTKTLRIVSGLLFCIFLGPHVGQAKNGPNYGREIGSFQEYAHGIKGIIYAADDSTIFIKGFSYDGRGPDAYFWVGNSTRPSPDGYIVPYPEDYKGRDPPVLKAFDNTDIVLRLPQGKRLRDIKWLSVWCRRFTVDFGDIFIPLDLDIPKPRVLPEFSRLAHGLRSGNISILDSKTIYIPNLHYDGAGPDAYFWVGNGSEPHILGVKVPNEVGSLEPLRGYQGEDIEIVLPENLTAHDIDWLAVWCVQYKQNFGHVLIPKDLDVPPALGQTKITPHWWYKPTSSTSEPPTSKQGLSNCKELLEGRVQVQWELMGEDVQIQVSGRIKEDQYVAFGLSGEQDKPEMLGGDVVVVAYNKKTGKFIAEDYYMSDISQCDGKKGVCPDERVGGKNDAIFLHGERRNGITTVTYMRPLRTNEPENDRMIPESETSVIAAIGSLNSRGEANAHQAFDVTTEDIRIDFTSKNVHECTNSLYNIPNTSDIEPWPQAVINDEDTFSARIGPTGGMRGYSRITGEPSWGIAWYINDLLIPKITVERGRSYTFIVEGGNDPVNPARYHPFYITDSPEGGFGQKTESQQRQQRVFAGVGYDNEGYPFPTAAGRYCEWVHKTTDKSKESETFKAFFQTLRLECDEGDPAKLEWTVPDDAPDLLYYQCYSHNNLGWKIHVINPGERPQINASGLKKHASISTIIIASIIAFAFLR
ncbi:protein Skeletor, isoforms B/C isoform X1 [Vespula pensylvanica]|uniref:protein Skeletor, isoforms B/C isoform X1 n=1 Tax=Vespula pensylvanica TaxID=30213 RepID=UPI001CB9FFC9|nr:protein Skeletor, isoforms B/C isoform X1 [Vespula pensylvanica]XP_043677739.1 protein Skeletor, isoforms B/C isoform X1 [Vespula pensylvanica]XP_043677741.1 protein Skeletor, isoforms B/C isoform X1 [Vespula pensylvanica]XP_043677742.1 protein Skeletor, isoforms B/C isoform X1 [Vespula pensylvanica]XP_043677743.1 protein Skeletor, isoforms B/C isoform X1 [Vespula pensylvanica]XP_043677744.1 protein Skeletor, isoforms B/C isoform X1 [Vespula pensylvanica]XP_043677745.1 protein Skeletor, is